MAKSNDLLTRIILKGQTDPSLEKAFAKQNKLADGSIQKLKKYGEAAKKAVKVASVAVAAGATASVKSAMDYESAFAGVKKTVDETETTKYADISKGIRDMSKQMPSAAKDIAAVAETAGQLGIKADDIVKFSKVMVQLGETTNLSSEDAASSIAKLFNITGTSMKNVDRFGSTIVALGNNAATTEADIMEMASRIAGAGSQIGLSEQQILALSTSLSSVGMEAEAGGSSISKVMTKIDKSVALNSKTLSQWAKLAGMSSSQFKKAWQNDAYGSLQKVVKGMGDAAKSGQNMNIILDQLGIKSIRETDTLKRLSNASSMMGKMTNIANEAWEKNSALTNEANQRYATMTSKLQIFKNKIVDVAITIGDKLMPYMDKMLKKMDEINWDKVADNIVKGIDKIGQAFQWLSEHSTTIIAIIGAVGGAFAAFKIASFVMTIIKVVKFVSVLIKSFGLLKVALALLGGPVGAIALAIGALIGIFTALWFKCEGFRNFFINMWNVIKKTAVSVGKWLANLFTVTIPNAFNKCIDWMKSVPERVSTYFSDMYNKAKTWTLKMVDSVVNYFKGIPEKISTCLSNTVNRIQTWGSNMWSKAKEIGSKFVNSIVTFFTSLPSKIGYALGAALGKIASWFVNAYNYVVTNVPKIINSIVTFFAQLPSRIWTWLSNAASRVSAWGMNLWNKAVQIGTNFVNSVVNFFAQLPSRIWTWLSNAASKVVAWGSDLVAKGRQAAQQLFDAVVNKIKEIPAQMLSIGADIANGLKNGITGAIDKVKSGIGDFCGGVKKGFTDFFKIKSPSRIMMAIGGFIGKGFGIGIEKTKKFVANKVSTVNAAAKSGFGNIVTNVQPIIGKVSGNIPKHGDGGRFTSPHLAVVGDRNETIVPDGNTPRNRALLGQAARGVGMNHMPSQINITFAPVIQGGNADENRKMLQEEEEEFERKMDAYFAKKERLAF